MAEQFPRYRPGDSRLSASDLNRRAQAAERQTSILGAAGLGRIDMTGGEATTPGPADNCWILILDAAGVGSGSGCGSGAGSGPCPAAYDWIEVLGADCSPVQPGDARSGTVCNFPATEINGNTGVTAGTVHRAWFRGDGTGLDFDTTGGCTTFTRIRVVTNWCDSGSGSGS